MDGSGLLLLVGAACLALGAVAAAVFALVGRRRQRSGLRAPLLVGSSEESRRLEVALREAGAGSNSCEACGFENFKRSQLCALCGARIMDGSGGDNTNEPNEGANGAQRLRRARNRKEWIRKLDVQGKLFWYRSSTEATPVSPGFVAQFHPSISSQTRVKRPRMALAPANQALDADSTRKVSTLRPPRGSKQIPTPLQVGGGGSCQTSRQLSQLEETAGRAQQLTQEAAMTRMTLLDASHADPGRCSMGTAGDLSRPSQSTVEWRKTLVNLVSRPFPDKYVHFVKSVAARSRLAQSKTCLEPVAPVTQHRLSAGDGGVFRCCGNNSMDLGFYLNANSAFELGEHHLVHCYATGRLIGRALLDGYVLGFHLALPLLKIILGLPVSFSDLEFFDPEAYKNMLWLLENDGVDSLGLDFSVMEKRGEEIVTVDLIPNGRNIDVTDDNKDEYLERRLQYTVFESVSTQLYVFLKGLYEVIPQELLMIFDPEEFDYLLCGSDEIDVDDWEKNTKYTQNLYDHRAMVWFWEIVREMPNEYRRRLLHFATGSSRVPIAGFGALTGRGFALNRLPAEDESSIQSCPDDSRLDLPLFNSRDQLKAALYAVI